VHEATDDGAETRMYDGTPMAMLGETEGRVYKLIELDSLPMG
jgi:hypothetical protein